MRSTASAKPAGLTPALEQALQRPLRRKARQQALGRDETVAGLARRFTGVLQDGRQFGRHEDRVRPVAGRFL